MNEHSPVIETQPAASAAAPLRGRLNLLWLLAPLAVLGLAIAPYFRKTGIFPIMHVVALRGEVLERHSWVAMNLFTAFDEAKRRSLNRALDITASYYPVPWSFDYARQSQALFGDDFWPYGIEANRATLEAFLQFAYEQGVCHRKLAPEDLFPAEVQASYRV